MATALHQLREAIKRNDEIEVNEQFVLLGGSSANEISLERGQATNFRSLRGRGAPLALDAVFYQWKFRDMPYSNYVQECARAGVAHVTLVDKKDLLAYLSGEITACPGLVAESQAPEVIGAPEPKRQKVDGVGVHTHTQARRQPREQRSLDAVLMVSDWDFTTIREKLSKSLIRARKEKPSQKSGNGSRERNPSAGAHGSFDPRGDRYTSTSDRFYRENLGSEFQEFGINPMGSFAKSKKAPVTAPSAANGSGSKADGARREAPRPAPSSRPRPGQKLRPQDMEKLRPIIIVPSAGASLVSFRNIKQFFEDGHFMTDEDLRQQGIAPDYSWQVKVTRDPGGNCSKTEYLLVNNPARLEKEEWDRVVGVVCSGKPYQFKHWKWAGENKSKPDIVNCLHHVQGFFFHYDDEKPDPRASSWAVKLIPISRSMRHSDTYAQRQFFEAIDDFIRRHCKRVRY